MPDQEDGMGHRYYETPKAEQAAAYRAHLRRELESFRERKVVLPRSHRRILKSED